MDYDYTVTAKDGSSSNDQGGQKFVFARVRELGEDGRTMNQYSRSFSYLTPEEVEETLLQVFRPVSLPEGIEDDIIRQAVNLVHSMENDTETKTIEVLLTLRPEAREDSDSDSDSDSDEEDQTELLLDEEEVKPTQDSEDSDSDSDSDSDEEEIELLPDEEVQPTPTTAEAIDALERLTLEAAETCAMCGVTLQVGDSGTRLPCFHTYHEGCIVPWMQMKNNCPQCHPELPTY
ncbi:hypothetical protein Vadar_000173 [Vaccinium darrowii]|uniref:Uncharacterized protein n=1 Tax=Vaccinium darrowii TaxID=229202 RepID=A0ACB7XWC9_9ERIC|nr:hypothetical protein Vadar_000173 [Vaccinium darrowii]